MIRPSEVFLLLMITLGVSSTVGDEDSSDMDVIRISKPTILPRLSDFSGLPDEDNHERQVIRQFKSSKRLRSNGVSRQSDKDNDEGKGEGRKKSFILGFIAGGKEKKLCKVWMSIYHDGKVKPIHLQRFPFNFPCQLIEEEQILNISKISRKDLKFVIKKIHDDKQLPALNKIVMGKMEGEGRKKNFILGFIAGGREKKLCKVWMSIYHDEKGKPIHTSTKYGCL